MEQLLSFLPALWHSVAILLRSDVAGKQLMENPPSTFPKVSTNHSAPRPTRSSTAKRAKLSLMLCTARRSEKRSIVKTLSRAIFSGAKKSTGSELKMTTLTVDGRKLDNIS